MLVGSLVSSSGRSVQGTAEVNGPHETEDPKNQVQSSGDSEPNEVQNVGNNFVWVRSIGDSVSKGNNSSDQRSNGESELQRVENHEDDHDNVVASLNVEERLRSENKNHSVTELKVE